MADAPDQDHTAPRPPGPTRRGLLERSAAAGLGAATAGLGAGGAAGPAAAQSAARPAVAPLAAGPDAPLLLALRVNGREHRLALDPRTTLLDALREHLGLTGTKVGCNHGTCGACTVHFDGRRRLACLTLAAQAAGYEVTTIEGLAGPDGALHPMQQAFVDHDALQCGYCTPGQIMSAVACVREGHAKTDADIREYMSGNLCRCGAYPNIVAAVREAAASGRSG